jgi:crotonobetainyl-CoA:carnitine CoA-transferase CaiB-like acyl-CoA transferase
MIAGPIRVPGVSPPARAAPAMGADTEAQLRAAGYSGEQIAALRASGVIADSETPRTGTSESIALAASG